MRNSASANNRSTDIWRKKIQLTYPLVCEFLSALRIEVGTEEDELNILCLEGASPRPELEGLIEVTRNTPDIYNDCIVLAWTDIKGTHLAVMRGTTEPGSYYTTVNPHPEGAAHLVWGRHLYRRGKHRGKPALVSATGMDRVWRDRDGDFGQDMEERIYKGRFGIHVHAGGSGKSIGRWSAGCIAICGGYEGEPYSFFTERINAHPGKVIGLTLWGSRNFSMWFQDRDGWRPTLRYGIRNPWVADVQRFLSRHMSERLVADDDWGPATQKTFLDFQRQNQLVVDGICGPLSWKKLEDSKSKT
ncbi:hypothetical protein GF359_06415 [candidate division WOR-3 bacterium]|uniref:Peptidoglycan binding-like domain-containing protein n=1 Tax=candidate division WOR-3 bacterium TaxID=2052148 RepID=A0A9D5K9P3_UNCW3|nr:hypothetical protein [candidate division WOR-3 bacterium]MBD3364832.1 hypothetical protein [candidate division WOR-3 bacterium]